MTETERVREQREQRERLAGLGTLAAGLAHELKNPAAAANRALALLGEEVSALDPLARQLAEHPWSAGEVALLGRLEEATLAMDQS
ncbi:MAG: ATPase, partial [Gemmatimonadaceae bacterium]